MLIKKKYSKTAKFISDSEILVFYKNFIHVVKIIIQNDSYTQISLLNSKIPFKLLDQNVSIPVLIKGSYFRKILKS